MKQKKQRKVLATFIIAGTAAVIATHFLDPNIKSKLKV